MATFWKPLDLAPQISVSVRSIFYNFWSSYFSILMTYGIFPIARSTYLEFGCVAVQYHAETHTDNDISLHIK